MTESSSTASPDSKPLEIHISTDKQRRLLIIQDTGIGMTVDELKSNLGTIAHSGSKVKLVYIYNTRFFLKQIY